MKVLISGGAGYIGCELVKHLIKKPSVESVTIYDNLSRKNYNLFFEPKGEFNEKIKFIQGDILDRYSSKKAIEQADFVYHLAARVSTPFADSQPQLFDQVNHWGTAEWSSLIKELGEKPTVYLSSISVYGSGTEAKTEESSCNPKTFYGISKLAGEKHIGLLDNARIIRCGNVYGFSRGMRIDAVINRLMFDAQFKNRIQIQGTGNQERSFIHIERLASYLGDLVDNLSTTEPIVNLVESNYSIIEIAEIMKDIYDDLEFLFINQQMEMRTIKVNSNHYTSSSNDLKADLENFKSNFAFGNELVVS